MTDPTALPNFTGGPTPGHADETAPQVPLAERVREALTSLGSEARIDDDGDVEFIYEDQQMFVRCADEEAQIVRVFGQWQLQEPVPTDELSRLRICNDVNVAFNLVKTAVANDTLLVTSEHIIPLGADVRGLLSLAVPLTVHGVQLWHQRATGQLEDFEAIARGEGVADLGSESVRPQEPQA